MLSNLEIQKLENRFSAIMNGILVYYPEANIELIRKAFDYGLEKHAEQRRESGEPYFSHPLEVLDIVSQMKLDNESLIAAILHDVVEDTDATIEDIQEMFGDKIAYLINGVTKISKFHFNTREEAQAENFRKMLMASVDDPRVLLVKFADRLHNMRTLKHVEKEEKRKRVAQETLDIYAKLAHRLGLSWIKTELEDLSFQNLYPEEYYDVAAQVAERKQERENYVNGVVCELTELLKENNMNGIIQGRPKHLWSIYRKMQKSGIMVEDMYDLIGFRVILDDSDNSAGICYEMIGYIHKRWNPIQGRFKDYVSTPKGNGYQSLHTTVLGPQQKRIEVQVRTNEMHDVAESGVAAHWAYKEGKPGLGSECWSSFAKILKDSRDAEDSKEFIEQIKENIIDDSIYALTPKNTIVPLPPGSSVIDFAYAIHTDVGKHCYGAKVNGRMVPLKTVLKSQDVCEIITKETQTPKEEWLKYVRTSRAKQKIRKFVREQKRIHSLEIGRKFVEKYLKQFGSALTTVEKNGELKAYVEKITKYNCVDDLLVDIGCGKANPELLAKRLTGRNNEEELQQADKVKSSAGKAKKAKNNEGIIVDGVDGIMITLAKCCSPLPGDDIRGFITRGRGVSVHRCDCRLLSGLDSKRFIDVVWDSEASKNVEKSKQGIHVRVEDKPGMLNNLTQVLSDSSVNVTRSQSSIDEVDFTKANLYFEVAVNDVDHLRDVMKRIRQIPGVRSVRRSPFP